jgi:hypothetical protein
MSGKQQATADAPSLAVFSVEAGPRIEPPLKQHLPLGRAPDVCTWAAEKALPLRWRSL